MLLEKVITIPHWFSEEDKLYLLYSLLEVAPNPIHIGKSGLLFIKEQEDSLWVDFALMDWAGEEGEDAAYKVIFAGGGPSGSLREMRHIWWGEQDGDMKGYTYYLPAKKVIEALTYLGKYFDLE